jgi:regulator of protease activity HflC (stomatin/prohibitin superfamily)
LVGTFYIIPAGRSGILLTFGKPSMNSVGEGLHVKIPLVQQVIKMDVRTQKYEADASAASKDLQIVTSKIATNYHLIQSDVPKLYREVGVDYPMKIIMPMEQEVVKAVTARFTAEELITKREEVRVEIKQLLTERLAERSIIVEEVSIVNFDFSPEFNRAIEAKVTAEQNALAAKNKLEQVKYEAQQLIAAADGKAQAMSIESKALRENPDILQLRAIEKWNGQLPTVTGGAIPFISIDNLKSQSINEQPEVFKFY